LDAIPHSGFPHAVRRGVGSRGGHGRGDARDEPRKPRLVEPDELVPPPLYVVSREADTVNGLRFDANLWHPSLPRVRVAHHASRPAGFEMHPQPA
jgi:hypothetical protein